MPGEENSVHPDPTNIPGAHFIYATSSGHEYEVTGQAMAGNLLEGTWIQYGLSAQPHGTAGPRVAKSYGLESVCLAAIQEADDPLGGDPGQFWWSALRRFAVEQTLNELDMGQLTKDPFIVRIAALDSLRKYAFRTCLYQRNVEGVGLHCTVDYVGDPETTLLDCAKCSVPDEWSICAHLCHIKTKAMRSDQGWIARRSLGAMCQIGQKAPGGIAGCKGSWRGEPVCFRPRIVQSPSIAEGEGGSDLEDIFSSLNVEWKRVHGFPLFTLVSFQPLKHLRSECASSADFHSHIAAISEVLEKIDEASLRKALDSSRSRDIAARHTVSVLEAFLLAHHYASAKSAVGDIRAAQRLRNLPPTHGPDEGGVRALETLRELGIEWPIPRNDWPLAWQVVKSRFIRGLKLVLGELRARPPGILGS